MNHELTLEETSNIEVSGPRISYIMFRFQSLLEQLESEMDAKALPVELKNSYTIELSQGKVRFSIHPKQTNELAVQRLKEVASESFGCWLTK